MSATGPTPIPELNAVLAELVARQRDILGENLVGTYLQGSFAVGDFNDHSDVDFVAVVHRDIAAPELARLQQLHADIHQRASYWAKHLEGSYAPAAVIRKLAPEPRDPPGAVPREPGFKDPETGLPPQYYPFLFLGNGSKSLVRSEHDNSRVARWILRERGITLIGPLPATLIDRVTGDELRADVRANLPAYTADYFTGRAEITAVWQQAFFVTLACRMLHTLKTGEIHSKRAGTAWALQMLPAEWHGLIQRAEATWVQSQDNWHHRPDPAEVAATLAFMRFAVAACQKPTAA